MAAFFTVCQRNRSKQAKRISFLGKTDLLVVRRAAPRIGTPPGRFEWSRCGLSWGCAAWECPGGAAPAPTLPARAPGGRWQSQGGSKTACIG